MSDRLSMVEVAKLLEVTRARVWQLRKEPGFPEPAGREGGRDYYVVDDIWRWLISTNHKLAGAAPVLMRRPPAGTEPAPYLGVAMVEGHAVLQWDTVAGPVGVVYKSPYRETPYGFAGKLLTQLGLEAVVQPGPFIEMDGPDLTATDRRRPDQTYEPLWEDLSGLLGGPVPYWPSELRNMRDIESWHPGADPITTTAIPVIDPSALFEQAAAEPQNSTIRPTLNALAQDIRNQAHSAAHNDVELIADTPAAKAGHLHIAAVPLAPADDADPDVAPLIRRDAWIQLLHRTDTLAGRCVEIAYNWGGGADLPFGPRTRLHPTTSPTAAEWEATLEPADQRLAAFTLLDPEPEARYYLDPASGAPVTASPSNKRELQAVAPRFLATTAPLAAIILEDRTVWIRTDDDQLWLAPQRSGSGYAWGYRGTGPITLARLLPRLLDDITAQPPEERTIPDPGLLDLVATKWPDGTVLTRAHLLTAMTAPGA